MPRWRRLTLLVPFYLLLFAGLGLWVVFSYYTVTIPNPMVLRNKERAPVVRVLARDGSVLAERGALEAYIPIDLLPRHLLDAVIATEDRRFHRHWGLDPVGLLRAALANLRAGRIAQGGSTITQQLAKNLFLTPERSMARKLEELMLAFWLEARLDKRDILELYVNRVYFGGGAYGVESAAQRFFGKSARDVTLEEAAVLAGLIKAPSRFSPASNQEIARARARTVLDGMLQAGLLSPAEHDQASVDAISFSDPPGQREEAGVEYAVDAALEDLPAVANPQVQELIVETTIDADLQRRAQAMVYEVLTTEGRSLEASQAALIVLDVEGDIRALVGGRSYAESQFNRALKAKRQPGSTFKPFVYLAALENGLTPDSVVQDLPLPGRAWQPRNYDGRYRGEITLREAIAQSINTVAVRLHTSVGRGRTVAAARRLGISSELRDNASLALGTSEVTLLELTRAYVVLANGGRSLDAHIVRRVRTGPGRVLYQRWPESQRQLIAPAQVGALNDMLNAALVSGTGRRAAITLHPAAGKTGTSQDFRDAWFVGYTAHFAAGVWVGNDDRHPMRRVVGGSLPAKLWHDIMTLAHRGHIPRSLPGTIPALAASVLPQPDEGPPARLDVVEHRQ